MEMSYDTVEKDWIMNTLSLPGIEPQLLVHPAPRNFFNRTGTLSCLRHLKPLLRNLWFFLHSPIRRHDEARDSEKKRQLYS